MADPQWWRRFAREVVWTPEVHVAVTLAGLEIPPEGRPDQFRCPSASVNRNSDGHFVCWAARMPDLGCSTVAATGAEVIAALQPMPAYGASGKALRAWLQLWGAWSPPVKASTTNTSPPPIVL